MGLEHISFKEKFLKIFDISLLIIFTYTVITSQSAPMFSYIILMILSVALVFRLAHEKQLEIPEKTVVLFIIAFLIVQLITSFTSIDLRQSITVLKIRIFYYVIFFASIFLIKTRRRLEAVLASLIIFTSIMSIAELWRFFVDITALQLPPSQSRIGYSIHPISTGEIKMLVIFIIIPLLLMKEKFLLSKALMIVLSIPIALAFLFTYARGAFIALFSGLILIGFLRNKKVIFGTILFLVLYFLVMPESVNKRMLTLTSLNDRSVLARGYMVETGLKIAKDNLLFGVGSIRLKNVYEKYKKVTIWGEGDQLHNNIIQLLVTMGIFGLLIWIALMFYIFKKEIENYRKTKGDNFLNALAVSSLVSMVGFQISGLTDWNFADYSFVVVFWFTTSLAFLSKNLQNETTGENG